MWMFIHNVSILTFFTGSLELFFFLNILVFLLFAGKCSSKWVSECSVVAENLFCIKEVVDIFKGAYVIVWGTANNFRII